MRSKKKDTAPVPSPEWTRIEQRLERLETAATYQDDAVAQLGEAIARQQKQLDELVRELAALRAQLADVAGARAAEEPPEIPPHY